MKQRATPGPWTLETVRTSCGTCHKIGPFPSNSGIRQENYACVYADNIREHDYGHSKTGDELLANARLMAAAPDMLAALQAFVNEAADLSLALRMARAAIARATGEKA